MTFRVMWLLNHSSARKFEIPMLKSIGIKEIFLPKLFPCDPMFRSASADWSEDQYLSIPKEDLDFLNSIDWYRGGSRAAWDVANRYFDICFFILHDPGVLKNASKYFNGALLWRAYGLDKTQTYSNILGLLSEHLGFAWRSRIGDRLFFAKAYDHIDNIESFFLAKRSVYLPLGLHNTSANDQWQGSDKRILFVCPDIGVNPYYKAIYTAFVSDFSGLPYAIGGAQPTHVDDPAVLGFTPLSIHERNMRQMRLMFYHSSEPNHIHYHPFEAIRTGMPLVFMGGGMLDRMGGKDLPGRCASVKEARAKIERILNDDWKLIEQIRQTQTVLLEPMKAENCEQAWRDGFQRILAELNMSRTEQLKRQVRPKRIAVIVPVAYRGGSLRGAKLLAQAIYQGSRQLDEAVEVVFLHLDDPDSYSEDEFSDLPPGIGCRPFSWKMLTAAQARRAMRYAGHSGWEPPKRDSRYNVVDDGINQLVDCDLWVVVSDRLMAPLLPLRPCVHVVYDYLQRYMPFLSPSVGQTFLDVSRRAERVLVTTRFTQQDALQYAGISPDKVHKVPMLAPDFSGSPFRCALESASYFVWTTNAAPHKNHEYAFKALKWYYEELGGQMDCLVTGVDTANLQNNASPHLARALALLKGCRVLQQRLRWQGELSDTDYQRTVAGAAFLWHAGKIDNGTFSVIEAASLGVPALSSDYPAMREIDQQFSLNLAWMDSGDPREMAAQLKQMELTYGERRKMLPSKEQLADQGVDKLAGEYWRAIRECL